MKTAIVIGAGNRGTEYSEILASLGGKILAVAEPIAQRRKYLQEKYNISEDLCLESWEGLFERPKFADIAIIANMDRGHIAPTLAAIEKGYDILLEKPMAATPEDCHRIALAAERKGVTVLVCHVLRFTSFFRALKKLIDDGLIGKVMHIQHAECVGNLHQSHSFVRGNWRNSVESSCMILTKSCHDMDILAFLVGEKCRRVHSFGSLSYFRRENAPEGSPEFCIEGCPHSESCYYYAPRVYLETYRKTLFAHAVAQKSDPSDEDIKEALKTTDYGRCVFKCNNDAVDHQTVNLEFESGATASFTMCAFNRGSRNIRIMGTDGELSANMGEDYITFFDFRTRKTSQISISETVKDISAKGGHGGGDAAIVDALLKRMDGDMSDKSICTIKETYLNHLIAFAAEESRLKGSVIDLFEYEERINRLTEEAENG